MLKLLGVSKSGYYAFNSRKPSKNTIHKQEIKKKIVSIYNDSNQIYGAPKITKILENTGYRASQKTVQNYMKELGIKAIWVKKYTKTTLNSNFDTELKNILNRKFAPEKPNTVWVTDITYINTVSGFVYLTSIMDLYSRKIISWHISSKLTTEGVIIALRNAKNTRKTAQPLIIHSDRGSQYVSQAYLDETCGFIRSYSKKSTPWDNACIESFHALIKREWLNRFLIKNIDDARTLVFEYINTFYNTVRVHSYCGYVSPYDFEKSYIS